MADPLDLRGLKCLLVVLKIRRAMRGVPPGRTLAVLADDPMALLDVPVMRHRARLDPVAADQAGGRIRFAIRKPQGYMPPEKPGPIK